MSKQVTTKNVICFGEALIDMLSNKVANDAPSEHETFTKYAGGAPANVAVALAKLGGNSYFCGMLGKDPFGDFLHQCLQEHGVNTDCVLFTEEAKTALAFVSLDEQGERTFSFYRPPAADLCFTANDFKTHWFSHTGIFHFCSNSLTESSIYEATKAGISLAKQHHSLISFDVNLRSNLWAATAKPFEVIWSLIADIDVLKVSKEELLFLCAGNSQPSTINKLLGRGCKLILISDGGNPLQWIHANGRGEIAPPRINMLDATAAGDAFVGGLLYKLQYFVTAGNDFNTLLMNETHLTQILKFAAACGAHAASKYGAFPSLPTLPSLQSLSQEIDYDIS